MSDSRVATATSDTETKSSKEGKVQLEIRKGADRELRIGGLRFVACRREVGAIDGGVSLYVWSGLPGSDTELLRFDLFRERPHYHAPAENQAETRIDCGAHANSLEWGADVLASSARGLVQAAGFADIAAGLDDAALRDAGASLRGLFESLPEPTEVSYFEVDASLLEALEAQG